jgi:hypothetical protein
VSRTRQLYARCLNMHGMLEIKATRKTRALNTYYILYVTRLRSKKSAISSNHCRSHRLLSRHSPMHSTPINPFQKG